MISRRGFFGAIFGGATAAVIAPFLPKPKPEIMFWPKYEPNVFTFDCEDGVWQKPPFERTVNYGNRIYVFSDTAMYELLPNEAHKSL